MTDLKINNLCKPTSILSAYPVNSMILSAYPVNSTGCITSKNNILCVCIHIYKPYKPERPALSICTDRQSCKHPAGEDAEACQWGGLGAEWSQEPEARSCHWRCPPCAPHSSPWTRPSYHWAPACCRRASQRWAQKRQLWGCSRSSWCTWSPLFQFPGSEPKEKVCSLYRYYKNW